MYFFRNGRCAKAPILLGRGVSEMAATSDTVATLYKHIGRRVIAAKEHTELHLLAILPLVFEIFVRLSVLNHGTVDTLFALRRNLEGEYTDDGLPAQSIMEVGFPPRR